MTNMQRWLESEQAPQGVAELLAAARPPRPLDAVTRARSRRRLATMTALPAAASVVFWIKSVALGAVLGSVVTAVVVVPKWHATAVPSAVAPVTQTNRAGRAAQRAPEQAPVEVVPEASAAPSATSAASAAPIIGNSNRTLPTPSEQAIDDRLGREIQLLERARQLLSVDPNRAMATLDEHRLEFGSGTLMLERQFLEVEALLRLGRRDQAIARAADLRARAPGSLYERRLSHLLGNE
jgi:hypothetical protein